jgi:large subunit ribosomal protein L14
MIQSGTNLIVADNSGAKSCQVFKVLGSSKRRYAYVGDIVVVAIKEVEPNKRIKKGTVQKGIIVRQKHPIRRADGSYVRFDDNAIVIIDGKKDPMGTRVFGPIAREVSDRGFSKTVSLAPEVI